MGRFVISLLVKVVFHPYVEFPALYRPTPLRSVLPKGNRVYSVKFCGNVFSSFCVVQPTNRQTNRATDSVG